MPQQVRVVSLRDLARAPVMVPVSIGEIPVRGLSAHSMMRLYRRFPNFDQLADKPDSDETREVMLSLLPVVVVEGLGLHDDPEALADAEHIPFDDQLKLFEAIMRETNPPGGGAGKSAPLAQSSAAAEPSASAANNSAPAEKAMKAPVTISL
jgi:hypothetical protein